MDKYYLNRDVTYKSRDTFSCIYHKTTGWYYPCKADFWKQLQTYRHGRELALDDASSAFRELIESRFLIEKKISLPEEFSEFYAVRMPQTVYYQDKGGIDVAVERKGPHDETDFDTLKLRGMSVKLWTLSDGTKTVQTISSELKSTVKEVISLLKEWTAIENQILRMIPRPVSELKTPPPQFIYKAPFLKKKAKAKKPAEDVHRYHLETIKDGTEQFDKIESTVSHLYRTPHPILGWKSYGQALYASITQEKTIESDMKLMEIGGGAGNVSADIMLELKKDRIEADYIIYDLSPALINSQRELHRERGVQAQHINGNGEALAIADSKIDIALSNEVIADLHTPLVETDNVKEFLFDHEIPMSEDFFRWYIGAPEKVRVNLGAFQLLKELYRVLTPGGLAVISEFGYQDRLPFRAGHLDHPEYSIQFSQMISVAASLGFGVYLTDIYDFLGFREDVKLIDTYSYQAALRILEQNDLYLPNITYSEEMLNKQLGEKAKRFRGISFVEAQKDPFKIVKLLVCRKP